MNIKRTNQTGEPQSGYQPVNSNGIEVLLDYTLAMHD